MAAKAQTDLSAEQRREIAAWFEANSAQLPESVRIFLALHHKYLAEDGDPRRAFESAYRDGGSTIWQATPLNRDRS